MRKMVAVAVVVTLLALLTGCNDDAPTSTDQELDQIHDLLKEKMSEFGDDLFWTSASTAANLISDTYKANNEFAVSIMASTSGGDSFVVERRVFVSVISTKLRIVYRIQLLLDLANDEKIIRAYDKGEDVMITGSNMKWYEFGRDGKVKKRVEVYDLDNDGLWDPESDGA